MRPPNIVFILSDQHRFDAMACAGHPIVNTPNLDRLASEGTRFKTAYCQSPLCGPSRSSILTGTYPHTCKAYTHQSFPLAEGTPTIASVLRKAGYQTVGLGKMHVLGETRERDLGFDERALRFYTHHFEDYLAIVGKDGLKKYARYLDPTLPRFQETYNPHYQPIDLPEELIFDHLVTEKACHAIKQAGNHPLFLWVGLEKPHPDWFAPQRFHNLYNPTEIPLPTTLNDAREDMPPEWFASTRQNHCFTTAEIRNAIAAYFANVTYMDEQVGHILNALEASGKAQETLVIYASDHGEMLFDHGMVQKHCFFEGAARVPLILRQPGTFEGGTVRKDIAALLDLFPTITNAAGIPTPIHLEGRPLQNEQDRPVMSEFYEWGYPERMIRSGQWKYIESIGRTAQLYNLKTDPEELHNQINAQELTDTLTTIQRSLLADWEQPDMSKVHYSGAWNSLEAYHFERKPDLSKNATAP